MCYKYVNTNVQCFKTVKNSLLGNTQFSNIVDTVYSKQKNNKFIIDDFSIVTFINIRGTKSNNPYNPLDQKKKLLFKIRLTKIHKEESKQLSYDLRDFSIDLSDKTQVKTACFDYLEKIEVTNVNDLELNEKGSYVIKILIKDEKDSKYQIQMVHPISVK